MSPPCSPSPASPNTRAGSQNPPASPPLPSTSAADTCLSVGPPPATRDPQSAERSFKSQQPFPETHPPSVPPCSGLSKIAQQPVSGPGSKANVRRQAQPEPQRQEKILARLVHHIS